MRITLLAALFAAGLVGASDVILNLYHRLLLLEPSPFILRGTVQISSDGAVYAASKGFQEDLSTMLHKARNVDGALYQVALQREHDLSLDEWDLSSIKACHITESSTDHIYLHQSGNYTYAVDYFVSSVPHDGFCPSSSSKPVSQPLADTKVTLRNSNKPPQPILKVPPPLTQDGKPIEVVPEKSFIQKYWMYVALVLLFILLLSPEDPKPGEGGGDGGGAAAPSG